MERNQEPQKISLKPGEEFYFRQEFTSDKRKTDEAVDRWAAFKVLKGKVRE